MRIKLSEKTGIPGEKYNILKGMVTYLYCVRNA